MTSEDTRRLSRGCLVVITGLVLLAIVWWPFVSERTFPIGDWQIRATYASYTLKSVFTYAELPFWATSPAYHQIHTLHLHGFFSNPETEVLSPYVVLYALFTFATAVRISLFLHLLVGVIGLYLLLWSRGVRNAAVVLTGVVLLFGSGFFVRHLLAGHFQFVSYTYFPLALWFYLRAVEAPRLGKPAWRDSFACGFVLACAYYEGNVHLVIGFVLTLCLVTRLVSVMTRRRLHPLACLAVTGLGFVLLAGFKLFPGISEYGAYHPIAPLAYADIREWLDYALNPLPARLADIPHEMAFYLGVAGLLLFAAGLMNFRKRTAPLAASAYLLLAALLVPGDQWMKLPLLSTQLQTRLRGQVLLLAVVLAGELLGGVRRLGPTRRGRARAATVCFAVAIGVLPAVVAWDQAHAFRAVWRTQKLAMVEMHDAALEPPAATIVAGSPGTVSVTSDGPNGFSALYRGEAGPLRPALIVFPDIGAREGRRLSVQGGRSVATTGSLTVRVTAPVVQVNIRYRSAFAAAGLAATVLGLVVFGWLTVGARRRSPTDDLTFREGRGPRIQRGPDAYAPGR